MGRRRLATSMQSLGRNYFHYLFSPLPKSTAKDVNGGFLSSDVAPFLSRDSIQSSRRFGEVSKASALRRRLEFSPSRTPLLQGRDITRMVASIDLFDSQRVARSDALMSATSGRSKACSCEQRRRHTSGQNFEGKEKITVTFVDKDGDETQIQVPVGMSMLEAAHENEIELEGACEGSLACSTCHVIVMDEDMYTKLPEPSDEENDMLDLAFGLTETSRLGCQVIANPELDGLHLALPAATRNFAVDGHVPKPH